MYNPDQNVIAGIERGIARTQDAIAWTQEAIENYSIQAAILGEIGEADLASMYVSMVAKETALIAQMEETVSNYKRDLVFWTS